MKSFIKENWFKLVLLLVIILAAISVAYYFYIFLPKNTKLTNQSNFKSISEENLRKSFDELSDMIKVNLCQEAYDKYITNESKQKKEYDNFLAHCNYRSKDWENFNITNIHFSDSNRADIRYSVDIKTPDMDSFEYKNCANDCIEFSCFEICNKVSPSKYMKKDWVETWILESGLWKRDY